MASLLKWTPKQLASVLVDCHCRAHEGRLSEPDVAAKKAARHILDGDLGASYEPDADGPFTEAAANMFFRHCGMPSHLVSLPDGLGPVKIASYDPVRDCVDLYEVAALDGAAGGHATAAKHVGSDVNPSDDTVRSFLDCCS